MPASGTCSLFLLPCLPSIQDPTRALCLHPGPDVWVLVFSSPGLLLLTAQTSLFPLGAGGRGTWDPQDWGLYLTHFTGTGFSQVRMWCGCCPVSSGLYFRKSCLCCIFIDKCGFGRRCMLLYSRLHLGSAPSDESFTNIFSHTVQCLLFC